MASIAAQSAGEIETIISQKASQVQAQANNLGKLRWRGFTSEIQNIVGDLPKVPILRSEEHTSELQSLMRISYAVFCLKKKNNNTKSREVKSIMHNYEKSNSIHIETV